jgi:hypothetical protein
MSNKSILKFVVAFGLLAVVLIFLGVNYVPRINASVSGDGNNLAAENQTRLNYIDELYPRAIALQLPYAGSDWIERHPPIYYSNSDWIERHPPNYYGNSDWIERHP